MTPLVKSHLCEFGLRGNKAEVMAKGQTKAALCLGGRLPGCRDGTNAARGSSQPEEWLLHLLQAATFNSSSGFARVFGMCTLDFTPW